MRLPKFDIGAHVRIKPMEDMPGRVVELSRTVQEESQWPAG